jgi:hypothetical protein
MSWSRKACLGMLVSAGFCLSGTAHADETFICNDGKTLTVTGENRAALATHPCVTGHYDTAANLKQAATARATDGPIVGHNIVAPEPRRSGGRSLSTVYWFRRR